MIYTIKKANLIKEQLRRFTTSYAHHVVGQFANIDFWLNEVINSLEVIDEYKMRFDNIYNAQKKWIEDHGTIIHEYCPICNGKCEFSSGKPNLPVLKHKHEVNDMRKELVNTAYFFLLRCFRIGLLTGEELKQKCDTIGTSIDPNDLK
ncbi:conserved hypothetical protein [Flavobacterium sp. 9AF]|uniref:hypothetical protein n=1 Tax=Flavobacterium sp. 9AF TaxID=2653142 RepID=UPI0012EF9218|nr:hypothetical protein [Flavobacterium sp. 9AF]VXB55878.1 conserved hypothetical protein [Flavobacterium sp. 9AF]